MAAKCISEETELPTNLRPALPGLKWGIAGLHAEGFVERVDGHVTDTPASANGSNFEGAAVRTQGTLHFQANIREVLQPIVRKICDLEGIQRRVSCPQLMDNKPKDVDTQKNFCKPR